MRVYIMIQSNFYYDQDFMFIRTRQSKKHGLTIQLIRQYKTTTKTGKVTYKDKSLGTVFIEKEIIPLEIIAKLDADEIFYLKNWLAEKKFGEKFFNTSVENLNKFCLNIPPDFENSLKKLLIEAKRAGIEFSPTNIMLESLLTKAWLLEKKIDRINGFSNKILSLDKSPFEDDKEPPNRKLFKEILMLNKPIEQICQDFNSETKKLNKTKHFPEHEILELAGEMKHRNPNKPIKNWYFSVAIEVLLKYGKNPINIIKPEEVAVYWATENETEYTLKKAQEEFIKKFQVGESDIAKVKQAIIEVYQQF